MHRLQYSWKRDTHDSLHYAEFISEIWTVRETPARDPNTRLRTTRTYQVKQSCVLVIYNAFKNKSLTNATSFSVRLGLKRNNREIKFRLGGRQRKKWSETEWRHFYTPGQDTGWWKGQRRERDKTKLIWSPVLPQRRLTTPTSFLVNIFDILLGFIFPAEEINVVMR